MKKLFYCVFTVFMILSFCILLQAQEDTKPVDKNQDPAKAQDNEEETEKETIEEKEELTKLEKHIRDLLSDSLMERITAEQALAKMGEEAVPEINKLLGVEDMVKQPEISDELKEKIEKLIKGLDSEEWAEREAATKELETIGQPAEIYLRRVAQYGTPEAKTRAEKLIEKLEEKTRGGKTTEELEQRMFWAKLSAIKILSEINSDSCTRGLLSALGDNDPMISSMALLKLRVKSGWSLGFAPEDIAKNKQDVIDKWTELLKKPVTPTGDDKITIARKLGAGETIKTSANWNIKSLCTTKTITNVVVAGAQGQQQKNKTEQRINEYTYITDIVQEQSYVDEIEKTDEGMLQFIREYKKHRQGANYQNRMAGNQFIPSAPQMQDSMLSSAKIRFTYKPGHCDLKILQGSVNLSTKDWLSSNNINTELLLPKKPVAPGDSWELPELDAFKFLNATSAQGTNMFDLSSIKIECKFLEVIEKDGAKKARISIIARFGDVETMQNNRAIRVNIVSYGYGRTVSLANSILVGDCVVDMDSGIVNNFRLFGTLYDTPTPENRGASHRQEQSTVGHFNLGLSSNKEK